MSLSSSVGWRAARGSRFSAMRSTGSRERGAEGFRVTFLGKNGSIAGQQGLDYLEQRAGNWDCTWRGVHRA